jgi:hypothetical protein
LVHIVQFNVFWQYLKNAAAHTIDMSELTAEHLHVQTMNIIENWRRLINLVCGLHQILGLQAKQILNE